MRTSITVEVNYDDNPEDIVEKINWALVKAYEQRVQVRTSDKLSFDYDEEESREGTNVYRLIVT